MEISNIDQHGTHTVRIDVTDVPDLGAGLYAGINDGMSFAPDHVCMGFTWSARSGVQDWRQASVSVSGLRRLKGGELGKERKKRQYYSKLDTDAPAWLVQLVRTYTPSYPVGVALEGKLPVLLDLAELEAERRG